MKWISVKDRLPEMNVPVLVAGGEPDLSDIWIMVYIDGSWSCPQEGWGMNVTHWMPLPAPPKIKKT